MTLKNVAENLKLPDKIKVVVVHCKRIPKEKNGYKARVKKYEGHCLEKPKKPPRGGYNLFWKMCRKITGQIKSCWNAMDKHVPKTTKTGINLVLS